MPYLRILTGPSRDQVVALKQKPCRIGRDANVEVCLDDSKASRVHAEIINKDGQVILRDLSSKNSTLVNGVPVTTLTLKEGDQIQIGETRLAFSMQAAPPPSLASDVSTLASTDPDHSHSFETLELNAPLAILTGNIGAKKTAAQPEASPTDAATYERTNRSLRALYSLARAAAEAKFSADLWSALSAGLQTALEADRVTTVLLDEKGRWNVADVGDHKGLKTAFSKAPVSRAIVDYALRSRRSVLTATRNDTRFEQSKSIGEQGIVSALAVPVIYHDQILGLVYADRLGGQDFVREDQELMTAACLQAAPALETLRRLEDALAKKELLLTELKSQHHILGKSSLIREVVAFIERAAPTNSVVLVLGESGTGKELVARAIHYNSKRSDAAFVVVNCAALTETLIESELFGHAKGAFTGAAGDRVGRFEMAHNGTIFLDEIGELSNNCQTKLLRVLEQGELSRVGEGRVRKVDARVLAATNRNLQAEVKAGRFREDLFYRLNVLSIRLPPLRDRNTDINLLLEHYLREASARSGRQNLKFSEEALDALLRYRWPGNIRELRNLTERLAVLCPHEVIGVFDLPAECVAGQITVTDQSPPSSGDVVGKETSAPLSATLRLDDIEKEHILRVLRLCDNNKKLAAEKLNIDRSTLYAKLRAYGILD
ncbi:MAG: sigma 54-interacting transcriptional regulator [Planctomycetota bacterium]